MLGKAITYVATHFASVCVDNSLNHKAKMFGLMMSWFCHDRKVEECHLSNYANYIYNRSMHFFLPFHWPRAHYVNCQKLQKKLWSGHA